jgi:uncharacterized membrane protein YagU involved in acid resistance
MARKKQRSALAGAALGLAAGAAATAVLTASQEAVSRARGKSQLKQQSKEPRTWAEAPPPAKVAKRVSEGVFSRRLTKKQAPVAAAALHWAYGTGLGALYGLVQAKARPHKAVHGVAFGTAVWAWAYVMLPALKIDEPIWRHPPKTLALDLSYHLVYGLSLAGVYEAIAER